jgi:hypothetical protein
VTIYHGQDGSDGTNGQDGQNGVTPRLKIENGYWYISYDNGSSWEQVGQATGDKGDIGETGPTGPQGPQGPAGSDGEDGKDGDTLINDIDITDDYILITLASGEQIQIPTWAAHQALLQMVNQMNTNIESIQTILTALQNNDYVTSITKVYENGKEIGYTINFSKSGSVTIYHGKDGQNGTNGTDGKDGQTPAIAVKQDTDGLWYWTLDGDWMLDSNGQRVKASGKDGADGSNGSNGTNGQDGQNGITPRLKIENGYWYISYDNGSTWEQVGQATGDKGDIGETGPQGPEGPQGPQGPAGSDGDDGKDGEDGDTLISDIDITDDYVLITLSNGQTIKLATKNAVDDVIKIQSITYIPKYSDGKACVIDGEVELDFQISPKSALVNLEDEWHTKISLKALYTMTRAVNYIDLPIISFASDEINGVFSITASASDLNEEFYEGNIPLSAVLCLNDGNNELTSNYIQIVPYYPDNNEIWYTATQKVNPNTTTKGFSEFGAYIVSNNWDSSTGRGVIKFSSDVISIGDTEQYDETVFEDCIDLLSIIIPNSVTEINHSAFNGCINLKSVEVGSNVRKLGNSSFANCQNLESIKLPSRLTSIPSGVFSGCTSLREIYIGKYVESIGRFAFESCVSLARVYIEDLSAWCRISFYDALQSSNPLGYANLYLDGELVTDLNIPADVTEISDFAFSGCNSIKSVTIANNVTTIGESTFYNCKNLKTVFIGNNVTKIKYRAFGSCSSLQNVYCEGITPATASFSGNSSWNAFSSSTNSLLIYVPFESIETYKSKNGWSDYKKYILGFNFVTGKPSLQNNTIKYKTTDETIVKLYKSDGLGVQVISNVYNNGVGVITCSGDITQIASQTFRDCSSLLSIEIPETVSSIGQYIFYSCSNLMEIYCRATTPPAIYYQYDRIGAFPFTSGLKIYVPMEAYDTYTQYTGYYDMSINQMNWSQYKSYLVAYDFSTN